MPIEAVLWDADGVLQRLAAAWRDEAHAILGPGKDLDGFLHALFAAEEPSLVGEGDLTAALQRVVDDWDCAGTVDDVVRTWLNIDTDPDVLALVRAVRAGGTDCHLATNQAPPRARHMSDVLGYRDVFDREFYSCQLGYRKPDVRYFAAILDALATPPASVLFLDDSPPNVAAAGEAGLHAAQVRLADGLEPMHATLRRFGVASGA